MKNFGIAEKWKCEFDPSRKDISIGLSARLSSCVLETTLHLDSAILCGGMAFPQVETPKAPERK